MKDIIFQYKSGPSFGLIGKYCGNKSIEVLSDGSIICKSYLFNHDEPSTSETIACLPEIASQIEKVLVKHENTLSNIPSRLSNGTLDGALDEFIFGKKKIIADNIKRTNIEEVKSRNPRYYEEYYENMIHENAIIDIYTEIIAIINNYNLNIDMRGL